MTDDPDIIQRLATRLRQLDMCFSLRPDDSPLIRQTYSRELSDSPVLRVFRDDEVLTMAEIIERCSELEPIETERHVATLFSCGKLAGELPG